MAITRKSYSKKIDTSNLTTTHRLKTVLCERCNKRTIDIDVNSISGICYMCMCAMTPIEAPSTSNRPRGWKFMKTFVDSDGRVFSYGEEVPELFGTLPATDVDEIRKKSHENKEQKKLLKQEREKQKYDELLLINEKQKEAKKQKKIRMENIKSGKIEIEHHMPVQTKKSKKTNPKSKKEKDVKTRKKSK